MLRALDTFLLAAQKWGGWRFPHSHGLFGAHKTQLSPAGDAAWVDVVPDQG